MTQIEQVTIWGRARYLASLFSCLTNNACYSVCKYKNFVTE